LVHLSNNQPHSVADSQFQTLFLDVFTPFRLSDPILFGIVYTLIFSAAKPAGGILFGVAFWRGYETIFGDYVKGNKKQKGKKF
jgi:hypothetical protein